MYLISSKILEEAFKVVVSTLNTLKKTAQTPRPAVVFLVTSTNATMGGLSYWPQIWSSQPCSCMRIVLHQTSQVGYFEQRSFTSYTEELRREENDSGKLVQKPTSQSKLSTWDYQRNGCLLQVWRPRGPLLSSAYSPGTSDPSFLENEVGCGG